MKGAIIEFTFFPTRSFVALFSVLILLGSSLGLAALRVYWFESWILEWLAETVAAILVALALSVFAGKVISKYLNSIKAHNRLSDIPWTFLISTSKLIEVNVHGWDGLFVEPSGKDANGVRMPDWKSSSRAQAWINFFRHNGHLVLILPKIPSDGVDGLRTLDERSTQALAVIAERTEKSVRDQVKEIEETIECAKELRKEADQNGSIVCRYVSSVRWICSARFDDTTIVLSTYSKPRTLSKKGSKHQVEPSKGPSFIIDASAYREIDKWVTDLHKEDVG
ncbi:hypothetical protein ABYF32_04425 [Buchananella felis]|uniref:hypothetical protein n=1 Tax=Buchananella felis TaxID=3231492 RepID=UPI00352813F7